MADFNVRYSQLSNGQSQAMNLKGVRELKDGMSIDEAAKLTAKNGLDEVFFEVEGKKYVGFADADHFEKIDTATSKMEMNGKPMNILKLNNEVENNFLAGAAEMTGKLYRAVTTPIRPALNLIPNKATGAALMAGIATGVIARTGIVPGEYDNWVLTAAGRTGWAAGGVIGLSTTKHLSDRSLDSGVKSATSLAYGVSGVAIGAALPDAIRISKSLVNKLPEPILKASAKVAGGAAIAAVTGGALAIVGNGIAAATRGQDLDTLNQIAK